MLLPHENDGNQLNQVRKRNLRPSEPSRRLEARISLRIHLLSCPNLQSRAIMHEKPSLTHRDWIWVTKASDSSETSLFQRNDYQIDIFTCHSYINCRFLAYMSHRNFFV